MARLPSAKKVSTGVSIYRVKNSPFWIARVWDRKKKKYKTRSTKETTVLEAKKIAQELAISIFKAEPVVETEFKFFTYAKKFVNRSRIQAQAKELNPNYVKTMHWAVTNQDWGLYEYFKDEDVRELRTHHWQQYLLWVEKRRAELSASTKNTLTATFRNVMKVAQEEGVIGNLP